MSVVDQTCIKSWYKQYKDIRLEVIHAVIPCNICLQMEVSQPTYLHTTPANQPVPPYDCTLSKYDPSCSLQLPHSLHASPTATSPFNSSTFSFVKLSWLLEEHEWSTRTDIILGILTKIPHSFHFILSKSVNQLWLRWSDCMPQTSSSIHTKHFLGW